jgi:DUF1680 family protein
LLHAVISITVVLHSWVDAARKLKVMANADTPADAKKARMSVHPQDAPVHLAVSNEWGEHLCIMLRVPGWSNYQQQASTAS